MWTGVMSASRSDQALCKSEPYAIISCGMPGTEAISGHYPVSVPMSSIIVWIEKLLGVLFVSTDEGHPLTAVINLLVYLPEELKSWDFV